MTFQIPIRVYIEDTDAGGIVFYANYLKFFERARTDFLRAAGITQSVTMQDNLIFVVRRAAIDYLQPARLDDELQVSCAIKRMTPTRVEFMQEAVRLVDQTPLVRAEVEVVSVRLDTLKPMAMSPALRSQLQHTTETRNV